MIRASFYKGKAQSFKTDNETQSRYWSIGSKKMSFTYFEVPPNAEFKKHRHKNEQITYVMKGKLFFEIDHTTYCLKKGDSILIPSGVVHRVWTTSTGATAIDSWTPAMKLY